MLKKEIAERKGADDILQMRDFDVKVTTKTFPDGIVMTKSDWTRDERPHNTGIVERS